MIRAYIPLKYAYNKIINIYVAYTVFIYYVQRTRSCMVEVNVINEVSFRSVTSSQGSWTIICGRRGVWAQSQHPEDLKELLGLEDESYLLVSIPTHYCMFLLFVFVFVYRRRICWGTMSCCQELHDMRSCWRWLDPGICHGVWTGRVEASLGRFPAGLLRIAPVMSDWLVIFGAVQGVVKICGSLFFGWGSGEQSHSELEIHRRNYWEYLFVLATNYQV